MKRMLTATVISHHMFSLMLDGRLLLAPIDENLQVNIRSSSCPQMSTNDLTIEGTGHRNRDWNSTSNLFFPTPSASLDNVDSSFD
jgi:hypothetical protein